MLFNLGEICHKKQKILKKKKSFFIIIWDAVNTQNQLKIQLEPK